MKRIILGSFAVVAIAGAVWANTEAKRINYYIFDPTNQGKCTQKTLPDNTCPTPLNINCTHNFGGSIGTQQLYTASTCAEGTEAKRS